MNGRTHAQRENSIPTTNKVCGGYKYGLFIYTQRPVIDANMFIKNWINDFPILFAQFDLLSKNLTERNE